MEAVAELYFRSLLAPLAAAFIVELAINRRPVVVALAASVIFSLALAVWVGADMGFGGFVGYIAFFAFNMLFGGVAALIGAGAARGLRLWIELRQDRLNTED